MEAAMSAPARLAVLLSGRGSNFESLADAVAHGRIGAAEIVAVISDNPSAPGLEAARARGLSAIAIERADRSRAEHERRVRQALDAVRPDLVLLAGYMRVLSRDFVEAYAGRILNIHPSLLPKYAGLDVHRRVLEAGESESGCTVHFVDAVVDGGRVIFQKKVPVAPGDTPESLGARVLEAEHEAYPEAVRRVLAGLRGAPPKAS
jgi:phosphoribosylglycinamide formyltransferase-1